MIGRIGFEEITVIVQGPVSGSAERPLNREEIADNITSIMQSLPGARIIVTTWAGEDPSQLPTGVEVIFNSDPGAAEANFLRQVSSVRAALELVNSSFVLKTRTDYSMASAKIVDQFVLRRTGNEICIIDLFAKRVSLRSPYLFHFSDTVQLGATEDLKRLWEIDQIDLESTYPAFKSAVEPWTFYQEYFEKWKVGFAPEQALWSSFARKISKFKYPHGLFHSKESSAMHRRLLENNLIIVNSTEVGISNSRHVSELLNWRARLRLYGTKDAPGRNSRTPLTYARTFFANKLVFILDLGAIVLRWNRYSKLRSKRIN